jgi:CheY-like chemotaxis protein
VTLRTELTGRFDTNGEDAFGQELARRLLAALGAQMTVEHGADGLRRAILDLPVALPSRTTDAERLMNWARARGGRLLVVDDSATNRMVVAGLLAKAGFSVETANGGAEAVEAVAQAPVPPEAVLMDVAMPDMDGLTATATIRRLGDERARIPIIAVTANALPEDRVRCLAAGMNDYLTKPVRRADLLGALERWLAPQPA